MTHNIGEENKVKTRLSADKQSVLLDRELVMRRNSCLPGQKSCNTDRVHRSSNSRRPPTDTGVHINLRGACNVQVALKN